jgi:DNA-binding transcriptional regulator YiaG
MTITWNVLECAKDAGAVRKRKPADVMPAMTIKPKKPKPMTPAAYRDAIAQLDLTQVAASDFFETARRTSPRWAQGEARIPGAVKKLLAVMISEGLLPEDVDKIVNQWTTKRE